MRPVRQLAFDRPDGRLLGERDHARGPEHGHVAAAQRERGVGLVDDERDDGAETGCNATRASLFSEPGPFGTARWDAQMDMPGIVGPSAVVGT